MKLLLLPFLLSVCAVLGSELRISRPDDVKVIDNTIHELVSVFPSMASESDDLKRIIAITDLAHTGFFGPLSRISSLKLCEGHDIFMTWMFSSIHGGICLDFRRFAPLARVIREEFEKRGLDAPL